MAFSRNAPAGLISKQFQRIVLTSTATLLNSTAQVGTTVLLGVEAQNVRITLDGSTTPTANTGVLLIPGNAPYLLEGIDVTKLKIARATAGAIVNAQSFGRVGDK
jgi:hypothetical protein